MIRIEGVTVAFGGVRPLEDLTVTLDGSIVGIVGPNGAGKTTLLNVMSGFVRPIDGIIDVDGTNLLTMNPFRRARWGVRRTFQTEQVVDELTVRSNVEVMVDTTGESRQRRADAVDAALDLVGLSGYGDLPALGLNAYERRLVEIGRAVVGEPKVIMMDEPGAGLSEHETKQLGSMLARIPDATGAQVLLIDHDVDLIASLCDVTAVLDFGRLIAYGPTAAALNDPEVKAAYLGIEVGADD